MMQSRQNHLITGSFNRVTKYHGKDFKNGWKMKDTLTFGLYSFKTIRIFAEIFFKACDIPSRRNILNIVLRIYYQNRSDYH